MKNILFRFLWIPFTVISLSGCIGSKQLDIVSYSLTAPSISKVAKEPVFGNLFVQDFYVNPSYEDKPFTYRTGELTSESDFYHQLRLSPRTQFTSLTRQTLAESGLFKAIIMPESLQTPEHSLEGNVSKFYVDFRDSKNPKVNLTISFRLYRIAKNEYQVQFAKTYEEAISLPDKSADAIAKAWNAAYANIMRQFIRNLEKLPIGGDALNLPSGKTPSTAN